MNTSNKTQAFQFRCSCGKLLKANTKMTGRKGKCKSCGALQVIPDIADAEAVADANIAAEGIQELCSICQSIIEDDDDRTSCSACDLPFHEECWEENLGCSAYGCENVDALKEGPDIRIGAGANVAASMTSLPSLQGRQSKPRPQPRAEDDSVTDYVLLGVSAIAAVVGFVTCGVPNLFVGIFAVWRMAVHTRKKNSAALSISTIVLNSLGLLIGLCSSLGFWAV